MESGKRFRWNRRHEKARAKVQTQRFSDFWVFELILLILIFSVWLIGVRILPIYVVFNLLCAESVASFGSSRNGLPAFDVLFWITVLMATYWAVIAAIYWRTVRHLSSGLFHMTLLGCLFLLAVNFRMMHIDDNSPPDGTLSVRQLARDTINDSREHFYTTSECVWLERNLITDHQNVPRSVLPKAEETPTLYKIMWDNMFGQTTALENVRAAQMYRTLTTDERAQFQHKQKCLKEKLLQPTQPETCAH